MPTRSSRGGDSSAQPTDDFDVTLRYAPRLVTQHLGSHKYSRATHAVAELVTNGFDAGATTVFVETRRNELDLFSSVIVTDNGSGMTRVELAERFGTVGVTPNRPGKVGRFGVGRWAVYRLGRISDWATTAKDLDSTRWRSTFTLNSDDPDHFHVHSAKVAPDLPTGTRVEVSELVDGLDLTDGTLVWGLLVSLCGYLLANPARRLQVNEHVLAIEQLVQSSETESLRVAAGVDEPDVEATVRHMLFKAIARTHFKDHVLFTAQGMTVSALQLGEPPSSQYVGVVESPYLDEMVTASRASFLEMDATFVRLRAAVQESISAYGDRLEKEQAETFIERARTKDFYPFRIAPRDTLVSVQQSVYDAMLEAIHRFSNLEALKPQHQRVIYGLLDRALTNGDVLHVLGEVATGYRRRPGASRAHCRRGAPCGRRLPRTSGSSRGSCRAGRTRSA